MNHIQNYRPISLLTGIIYDKIITFVSIQIIPVIKEGCVNGSKVSFLIGSRKYIVTNQ